ncbi:MAG TPA: tyrosine-type recombinase/integrase [Planctomycetaceae bacterium]|nr:tyrosine-type recombinase/integrase [Planctomycetaceae bacterium]
MAKSTRCISAKTVKPYPGFPLTVHPSGRWCKKILGKLHYFGKLDDPTAALERLNREWPYLKDGRMPPSLDAQGGLTVRALCNHFLTAKKARLESGELSPRTFADYFTICELLVDGLGRGRRVDDLRTDDFAAMRSKWSKTWGPVRLRNEINRARVVFKFAFDERLVDKPVHYGQAFARPSAKTLRKARNEAGPKLFTPEELKLILDAADVQLKAMTLLGLNCGFGNSDCAGLPQSAVDLESGWINFPRPKTEIQRRVPFWPETVQALRKAIAARPTPKDPADADCVFLTHRGARWVRVQEKRGETSGRSHASNVLSSRFAALLKFLGINSHRNFYTLRHTFETIAGESKDQVAVDSIMGHVDPSMGAHYRERISDARLKAVVNVVREWAFPPRATGKKGKSGTPLG